MQKKIAIDATYPNETRVVLLDKKGQIEEIEYETATKHQIKSNLYLAKVARVEPSLQAVFIDYGAEKNGFLPFSEIHPDYWNLPAEDKAKLKLSQAKELTPPDLDDVDGEVAAEKDLLMNPENSVAIESNDDVEVVKDSIQNFYRQYQVQEVIKKGQVLLVQAQKEERGNKGASFTTYVSLAGKYCVLMPNCPDHSGISRRISNVDERKRLRKIISEIVADDNNIVASVIMRTAGIGHSSAEIKRDYDYLVRLWNNIREATLSSKAPAYIHAEDDIVKKAIRDVFDPNQVSEILVQGSEAYGKAVQFINMLLPSEAGKLVEYKDAVPIFTKFGLEDQLINLYQPIVSLPSGGYIVINPTEALTSVDVNSGKATAERNVEETATSTNLEAAQEVAKQMRLRDISGLVVIDFIDMYEEVNKRKVEKGLRDALGKDKARIQLGQISQFGLLEMSRQRLKPSFLEFNTAMCHHCHGKGLVRSDESNSMLIFRTIANEIATHKGKNKISTLNIFAGSKAVGYILNYKRDEVCFLEQSFSLKLNFYIDNAATADSFSIEKVLMRKGGGGVHSAGAKVITPVVNPDSVDAEPKESKEVISDSEVTAQEEKAVDVKGSGKKPGSSRARRSKTHKKVVADSKKE